MSDNEDNPDSKAKDKDSIALQVRPAAASPVPKHSAKDDIPAETTTDTNYATVDGNKRKRVTSFPRPEVVYQPERIESWMSCLKCSLVVFNLVIWVLGAVLTALGIWVKLDKEFLEIQIGVDIQYFSTASSVLIAVGVLIMLIGFVGCYGSAKENAIMLIIYAVIVVIVIIMEFAVVGLVWSAISNTNAREEMKLRVRTANSKRFEDDAKMYFISLLQAKLHCCGVEGVTDYSDADYPIPTSCMNELTGEPFQQGCFDAILNYLRSKAAILGGIAIAVFLLQLGALVFTILLYCGIRHATKQVF